MKLVFVAALLFAAVYLAIAVCPPDVPCGKILSSVCGQIIEGETFEWFDNQCCLNATIAVGTAIAADATSCDQETRPGLAIS